MKFTKLIRGVFALMTLLFGLGIPVNVPAQAVPGGTLDPDTIPKYVSPLMIPPIMFDDLGGTDPLDVSIAMRQLEQQVLPSGFPSTTLWGYCDGSQPGTSGCLNPAFTIEVTRNVPTTVTWINDLVDADGRYLRHVIQDAAGDPLIDQTLYWAAPNGSLICSGAARDCRGVTQDAGLPYMGPIPMVTHLHGAHVASVNDGHPEAWWLPAAVDIPTMFYVTEGTHYADTVGTPQGSGKAVYSYSNDQPTATLWYGDLTVGIARLNRYAAGEGLWLIREADDGESGLISGTLPRPAPALGQDPNGDPAVRKQIREIPLVIQPRSFNADGSLFYPADRAFFEGLGTGQDFADNTGVNIPFLPYPLSDIAPVWNPEAFFNTMVVNGRTWPMLEVAPERYRFRLLNAADSRFLNLALQEIEVSLLPNGRIKEKVIGELPVYQIGADQSLLPQVVRIERGFATPLPGDGRDACLTGSGKPKATGKEPATEACVNAVPGTFAEQALLIAPGERADVIVDFTGLEDGVHVRVVNTAPDAPFGGFPDVPADPATTGQVMEFVIGSALANPGGDPSTPAPMLVLDSSPGGVPELGSPAAFRDLALLESESALLCVTVDAITGVIDLVAGSTPPSCSLGGVPFGPEAALLGTIGVERRWDDPIIIYPALGDVESWILSNQSADAHPIHLHQVKFEVLSRLPIGGGAMRQAEPWETGWKDTVIAYPGELTQVKALFDLPGLSVWHSNILSHQDNEMKAPYCVGGILDCL